MVDTPLVTLINPAPATVEGVNPAAVQAAPAVVTETSPAPLAPAPVVEVPALVPAPASPVEAVKPAETLLAADKPVVETPPAPAVEVQNTEGGQSAEPAPPPTYEPFTVPEGVTLDGGRVGELTNILATLELEGKADHGITQQVGQKLVDFHINEIKKYGEDIQKFYQTSWEKQKISWKDEFLADPILGGNNKDTTLGHALEFIRTHGGSEDEQKEFRSLMDTSGLGNHKAVIRILANAMTAMKEGAPLSAQRPPAAPRSRVATMYGNS